ncbi:hypothetical protein M422DRAFT_254082 [Sphaerobolus stellatus SS14]|uniref:Uncharacterized protein n=1 Tax=Sphaerobolus stellatus (strain SS14) TaxID=990650 RepID=A0A0C9VLK1_SPHS4|nr:hypothetical protein M422DRAFT_254082 [Sphaerobolus stellatus SS14]
MDLNSLHDRLIIAESEGMLTTQVVPLPTFEERRPHPQLDGDFDDYLGDGDKSIYGGEEDQVERRDDIESKLSNTEGEPEWTPIIHTLSSATRVCVFQSIYEEHAVPEGKLQISYLPYEIRPFMAVETVYTATSANGHLTNRKGSFAIKVGKRSASFSLSSPLGGQKNLPVFPEALYLVRCGYAGWKYCGTAR